MKAHSKLDSLRTGLVRAVGALALAAPLTASAITQVKGSIVHSVLGGSISVTFDCTGEPVCTGRYRGEVRTTGCNNTFSLADAVTITGFGLAQPGPISGTAFIRNALVTDDGAPSGNCSIVSLDDINATYTGTWDGRNGAFTITFNDLGFPISAPGTFTANRNAPAPVFPVTASGSIDAVRGNVGAQMGFRPQDVGTVGSVYTFALAPASIVRNAALEKAAVPGLMAKADGKDTAVPCVLAQLNASGQLRAVSAANLQAFVTGVLSGQGQAVTVVNGVPTVNIAGAVFFVGYGPNAASMINNGVNRSVAAAPGALKCDPKPPQNGWWWNTAEGGRGYSIEVNSHHLFVAAYLYDVSGRATWTIAAGNTSLDGTLFVGRLESYSGGQSLFGNYRAPGPVAYLGDITMAFNDSQHGTLIWPGGTIPIERFNIVPNGIALAPLANQPEGGWWWNPAESGRGFFLEWQGNTLFMAAYMYDETGNPLWYLSSGTASNIQGYANTWWQYANGQTLTGVYKPPQQVSTTVAPVTIQFQGAETGVMTLPGGRTSTIRRYRF